MRSRRALAACLLALSVAGCKVSTTASAPVASATTVGPAPSVSTEFGANSRPGTSPPSASPNSTIKKYRRYFLSRPAGLLQVHDPGQVTGTLAGPCRYRDGGQLPDTRCTPGSVDPAVTQADIGITICREGWTATIRPPEAGTERFKYGVAYPAYGTPQGERTELDHGLWPSW